MKIIVSFKQLSYEAVRILCYHTIRLIRQLGYLNSFIGLLGYDSVTSLVIVVTMARSRSRSRSPIVAMQNLNFDNYQISLSGVCVLRRLASYARLV